MSVGVVLSSLSASVALEGSGSGLPASLVTGGVATAGASETFVRRMRSVIASRLGMFL